MEIIGQNTRRWTIAMPVALALTWGLLWVPAQADARRRVKKNVKRTVLEFESRLQDERNKSVSGIFPMRFRLMRAKSKRSIWQEKHWVAVENGRYSLRLGQKKRLPKRLDIKTAIIDVSIKGAGTVLREPLAGADAQVAQVDDMPAGKRIVQYAEKAGFAYDAEHATIADRIGAYSAKELHKTLEKLKKRKSKVKVSRNRIHLTTAGGVGGTKFEQICPPGTVAVGLRGGAGIYIDNVQIVCAPLK